MARKKRDVATQESFAFTRWGGRRKGSGRKASGERSLVSHSSRTKLSRHHPVHVTMRVEGGLPNMRRRPARRVLVRAFGAGRERFGFRLVHYSIQSNHLHLIVEAEDRDALSRGLQGLSVRIARGLNRLWERRGRVFADRYHDRVLRTPREVRNALVYVLKNHARHGVRVIGLDSFSSAGWFDGWASGRLFRSAGAHVARARSWLLNVGWRRYGLLRWSEVPRARSS